MIAGSNCPPTGRSTQCRKILLIASDERYAELHRRVGDQWLTEILRGEEAVVTLSSVEVALPFAELYDGIALAA